MFMPATPIATSRSVIHAAFTALPPPVSTSAMTGIETACAMFQVRSRTSFIGTRPTSGFPRSEAARPKPDTWIASKPVASMTLALNASWQPGQTTARRPPAPREWRFSGRDSSSWHFLSLSIAGKRARDGFAHFEARRGASHVVRPDLAFAEHLRDGGLDGAALSVLAEPVEHHLRGEDRRDRVDLVLAGVLRSRAVRRLEDRELLADVPGSGEAEASDHLGTEVRDDVAVEVRRNEDVIARGILQQPHADGVHVRLIRPDARVVRRDFPRFLEEEPVGRPDNVRLVDDRYFLPSVRLRELEGRACDPRGSLARVDLAGDGEGVRGQRLERRECGGELREDRGELGRNRRELDARIEILRILPEDDEVQPFPVVKRVSRIRLAGPQADVQVEELPHAYDRRAVGETPAFQLRDEVRFRGRRRLRRDRPEESRVDVLQQVDRPGRKRVPLAAPELPADVARLVAGVEVDGIEDQARRVHDFPPDTIAGKPRDPVLRHAPSPKSMGSPPTPAQSKVHQIGSRRFAWPGPGPSWRTRRGAREESVSPRQRP